jgi:succinyldiaminopimelate transaminase
MRLNPVFAELGDYPIATIQARARDRRDAGLPVVDFSIGDPREPTPAFIRQAFKDAVPEVSQYPTSGGLAGFRSAVADYLGRRFDVAIDADTQVLPTSGSKEAIFSTALAFVDRDRGDTVVYPTPGYPIYERGARLAGAETAPVRLEGDFVLRADDIPSEVWDRARIVWTNSPHNPTGAVSSRDDLTGLCARARDRDTLLLSDECYADVYEEADFPNGPPSILQIAGDGAEGTIAYLSLSKRSGMTGYRSGAMVGDPEAIAALRELRSSTGTASQEFVQAAAIAAWGDDAHAAERRKIFAEKRRILGAAFTDLDLEIVASRAGLYLWVVVDDDLAVTDRLLEDGVVVSPGRYFGAGGEGYIRLALVPTVDECTAAADTLRSVLA